MCTASVLLQEKKVQFLQDKKKNTSPLRSAASATRNAHRDMNPITQILLPEVILPLPVSEVSKAEHWFI